MHFINPRLSSSVEVDLKQNNQNNQNCNSAIYMYRNYSGIMEPVTNIMNRLKTSKNNFLQSHFELHSKSIMEIIIKIIESKESKEALLQQLGELEKKIDAHDKLKR